MNKRIRITLPILLAVTGLTIQTPYVMASEGEPLKDFPKSGSGSLSSEVITPLAEEVGGEEEQVDEAFPVVKEESGLEKPQTELEAKTEALGKLQAELDEKTEALERRSQEVEALMRQTAELEERHSMELESLRAEATRKEKELSSQLKRGGKELERLKGEVEKATEQNASLIRELRQAQQKFSTMDRLKADLAEKDAQIKAKDAEIQRLRAEIDSRRISEVSHHKKPSGSYTTPLLDDDGLVADEVGCCGFKRKKLRQ
jgi:chromosome segregation ATPase